VLGVIDWRTYEIPIEINIFILVLGIVRAVTDPKNWVLYLLGFLSVSILLWLILVISKGRAIGGGDVKLMAAAGLLLGWKQIILAFLLGCILGSIIHLLRMKISGADRVLAMGPYLAAGIMIAALWGDALINWYLTSIL
jgi:leader peptidase (prepilin peptidase)/N-methyltransferase